MQPLARVTPATLDALDALLAEPAPVWGLLVVKRSGRPAGSVYPILERLERLGWLESRWEDEPGRSGPRRRLYRLTADGAVAAAELTSRARSAARGARATEATA
ncbi:PadR family transcriptional regulator [Homoserinibacter sp. YIM 151385]|uniref:PadR family transcriptional regulator n=1 Tax=Homoserinibacter sp. YIM 151385 TaxID=2985506 RepID=UPI0022F0FED3|nr:helix-turn-helix transcriptional regulator [Homoserinibacter sp. YIM 151385]WBU38074.1 helix-turn-helix transcriptional regulator [Homoserinibacter sp. YIM 151385]